MHAEVSAQRPPGHLPDLLHLHRGVVADLVAPVPGEYPVPTVTEGSDEGETIAHRVDSQHVRRWRAEPDVCEHDRFDHGSPGKGQPKRPTDDAAHAIGADHIRCPVRYLLATRGSGRDVDTVLVLTYPRDLGSAYDSRAQRVGAVLQEPLRLVLRGDQQ